MNQIGNESASPEVVNARAANLTESMLDSLEKSISSLHDAVSFHEVKIGICLAVSSADKAMSSPPTAVPESPLLDRLAMLRGRIVALSNHVEDLSNRVTL